jgi:hypothetical protein
MEKCREVRQGAAIDKLLPVFWQQSMVRYLSVSDMIGEILLKSVFLKLNSFRTGSSVVICSWKPRSRVT